MSRLFTRSNKDGLHQANALSWALEWLANKFYLATIAIRPTTVTIYNVATTDANWTTIASGLTGVLSWKLCERSGTEFHYCFDGVGTTYMTTYGLIQRDTAITAVYVKRPAGVNINLQLEVWTA